MIFNGSVPLEDRSDAGRETNQFEDNDFSRAKLVDVAFRTGIDLTRQRLPSGPEYTYLADAAPALRRARAASDGWDDSAAKKSAVALLEVMEDQVAAGQRQLLIRADDFPRGSRRAIRALLEAAQQS